MIGIACLSLLLDFDLFKKRRGTQGARVHGMVCWDELAHHTGVDLYRGTPVAIQNAGIGI